jgi:starvation-inducible DNA-binding protein
MAASYRKTPHDSPSAEGSPMDNTVALLDDLLTHTLPVRDLYKSARCQAADIRLRHLRQMFDAHYKEQLGLVDALVDRIRTLGGAGRVRASTFLQGAQPSYALHGHLAPNRLLFDLLETHESVLSAVHTTGTNGPQTDSSSVHDSLVGQVVLTNDLQRRAVREQLIRFDRERRFASTHFSGIDAYE